MAGQPLAIKLLELVHEGDGTVFVKVRGIWLFWYHDGIGKCPDLWAEGCVIVGVVG